MLPFKFTLVHFTVKSTSGGLEPYLVGVTHTKPRISHEESSLSLFFFLKKKKAMTALPQFIFPAPSLYYF